MLNYRLVSVRVSNSPNKSLLRSIKTKTVSSNKNVKKYTDTIQLPKTNFPSWLNSARAVERDDQILKTCGFSELYSWQRENKNGTEYVLHDGPPYANGLPHMGHAINKILKDIVIRQKLIKGHKIHYKPGWDCHGLPIELKALAGTSVSKMKPIEIRRRAEIFAKNAISDQRNIFKSWGVMADWNKGCYHTFDKSYIKNQLQQFWNLYEKGLVYRDLKPVYWSPSSETALAEAELVYNESHQSRAVAVRYRLSHIPPSLLQCVPSNSPVYLVIWTTTPWTLPANQAIAFNPTVSYSLVSNSSDEYYILASNTVQNWKEKFNKNLSVLSTFSGNDLVGSKYLGWNDKELPVVGGDHVTDTTGTGLVHTAPAHGHEDFLLAKLHNLPVECRVDEKGFYEPGYDKAISGLNVLSANEFIINKLAGKVLHDEMITHSYPYDWRTNKPVIIRASQQWFFDTNSIKSRALELLKDVKIHPGSGGLSSKVENRPYWCISRQRVWGVPIPSLYKSNMPIIHRELIDHYCELVDKEGSDFWWTLPINSLLPDSIANKLNININEIEIGKDILDIWFDSGLSWSSVLEGKVADLYLEGIDQFTGWFQSSLLTSVALQDKAPYKKIFVHGFAVDENGRKMSKSVGNVIDPLDIVYGRLEKNHKSTGYGVDLIRWWVGAHGHHSSVPVSDTTLSNSKESISKIRNISKFLLGALHDYPIDIDTPKLHVVDNYALHCLLDFQQQVDELYEEFQYNKVCSTINNFVVNQLSAFYLHLIKDRLYCSEANDSGRRAVQFVIFNLLQGLVSSFAPILPILAEEIYSYHPHNTDYKPFFMSDFKEIERSQLPSQFKIVPVVEQALAVKSLVQKEAPINCSSWNLGCVIHASPCIYKILKVLQKAEQSDLSELTEILQLSSVTLIQDDSCDSFHVEIKSSNKELCDRCRRYTSDQKDLPCKRCQTVLDKL